MNDPFPEANLPNPSSSDKTDNSLSNPVSHELADETNWVDGDDKTLEASSASLPPPATPFAKRLLRGSSTLVMVETAFLASTASLIWLIDYYFPFGPLFKIFFPVPIALVYLRWGSRAAWMSALVSGLLLSVLMGPTRSIVFLMPYGLMGVQLGACWRRGASWLFSIFTGTLIGTFGFFFRFWLFSILLGEDLWQYVINQITEFANWAITQMGWLMQPSFEVIQLLAVLLIFINNLIYLFAVHLVALLVLDRLGNPIPRPPEWIQVILDYE